MSIWFFLWLLLSCALLYFLVWTIFVLFRQKKAWQEYAKRNRLRYKPNTLFSSPAISGPLGDYTINIFTGEHMSPDMRGTRKLTALETQLSESLPVSGAVASGGMVRFVQDMAFKEEFRPDYKNWDKSWIAATESRAVLQEYLTPERLDALAPLMKIRGGWVILVFKGRTALLRFDTPDPLDTPEKIDMIVQKMLQAAKILEFKPGEVSRLKMIEARKPVKEVLLSVDESSLNTDLRLEDD